MLTSDCQLVHKGSNNCEVLILLSLQPNPLKTFSCCSSNTPPCHFEHQKLLLFQEYDFEIIFKPRQLNIGPGQLSWIEMGEEPTNMEENLLNSQLFYITYVDNYFENNIEFLHTRTAPN